MKKIYIMVFWQIVYNILIVPALWILLQVGGLFNKKIQLGIEGRVNLFEKLESQLSPLASHPILWFHASSLGEFEQAKPIIAAIKKKYPAVKIVATFFSPSGYEHSKNYPLADIISYIPFDSFLNAKKFVNLVRPAVAIMVRYDVWPNFVWRLHKNNIPIVLANATMKSNSPRMAIFVKQFHRTLYDKFSLILTVSDKDQNAFSKFHLSFPEIMVVGDTRFDQVLMRSIDAQTKNLLAHNVTNNKKVFIVGQSWGEDEQIIFPALLKIQQQEKSLLTIIVPHEPTVEHLEQLETSLTGKISYIRFSEMANYKDEKIILIDSVGVLVALYKYAHVVYVGGSFRQGIHNVLEPAIFGVPIIYGPKHTNSQEAVELASLGSGFVINDEKGFYKMLRRLLDDDQQRIHAGSIAQTYVRNNCGATNRFLEHLEPYLK